MATTRKPRKKKTGTEKAGKGAAARSAPGKISVATARRRVLLKKAVARKAGTGAATRKKAAVPAAQAAKRKSRRAPGAQSGWRSVASKLKELVDELQSIQRAAARRVERAALDKIKAVQELAERWEKKYGPGRSKTGKRRAAGRKHR